MTRLLGLSTWGCSICIAVISLTSVPRIATGADVTVEQVRAAWEKRTQAIKSFQYEYGSEEEIAQDVLDPAVTPPEGPPSEGFQEEKPPVEDLVMRKMYTFSLSGEKMAYRSEVERWDRASDKREVTKRMWSAFDSVCGRELHDHGGTGGLRGELVNHGKPGDVLTNNVDTTGLWLWYSPIARLKKVGFDPEKMTVTRQHVLVEGHDCAEVSIPDADGHSCYLVCVDLSRNCVPVQLVHESNGVTGGPLTIRYVSDDRVGWRVAGWSDQSGPSEKRSFEMKRCSINEPLDDGVFAFEFPEGAKVAEHDGTEKKYFIALADEKRRDISEREYFGTPEPEEDRSVTPRARQGSSSGFTPGQVWAIVLSIIGVAVVILVVLFGVFVWKRST